MSVKKSFLAGFAAASALFLLVGATAANRYEDRIARLERDMKKVFDFLKAPSFTTVLTQGLFVTDKEGGRVCSIGADGEFGAFRLMSPKSKNEIALVAGKNGSTISMVQAGKTIVDVIGRSDGGAVELKSPEGYQFRMYVEGAEAAAGATAGGKLVYMGVKDGKVIRYP